MSSPRFSLRLKKLRLSRKNKDDDELGPNKRAKTDHIETLKNKKACLQVSYKAYIDFKKRFQLIYFPTCIDNHCIHIDDRNAKIKQLPRSSEQIFNIEMKNKTWFEALEVCLMCITSNQYLSPNMLKEIVEIIMNAHENDSSGYTIEYILRQCQHTLFLHFRMHPPCISEGIRDCYKIFLTSPMIKKENTLSNRASYHSEEGIVSHCLSRLLHEISAESRDDTLIDNQEVPKDIDEEIQASHWKKDSFELFELLIRTERIERLMLVLECLINLLQTDLALWHSRRLSTNGQMRTQRPLLAYVLWPNCLTNGTVTKQCHKIMELYAYVTHLKYPEKHVKTISLWMNAVIQMFYMYEINAHIDYPNTNSCCAAFAREFCKSISPLPATSISRILERLQPSFMQHLIGIHLIKTILSINQNDIILIIISCINNNSWENFPDGDNVVSLPSLSTKSKVKPQKLVDLLSKKCKNFLSETERAMSTDESANPYPKLELTMDTGIIYKDHFITLLFITFVAYLETYNITNFIQTLNENRCNNLSSSKEFEVSFYEKYSVSDLFVKKYRSIIESLQELFKILTNKGEFDEPSKNLLDLVSLWV